jgi:anti-anti-sigma regulatory factor
MKLKLETLNDLTVLNVSEDIKTGEPAILKAGLQKIITSGAKKVLVDFTTATQIQEAEIQALAVLPTTLIGEAMVFFCGPQPQFTQAKTREEAVLAMESPLGQVLATENILKKKIELLNKLKAELAAKLAQSGGAENDVKSLKKDKSELKILIQQTGTFLKDYVEKKTEIKPTPGSPEWESVKKTVHSILQTQKVI